MVDHNNTTQLIAFNADVSDEIALAEGDEAADHIVSGGHMIDYLKVARALKVGQRIAVEQAGTDQGKPYNIAFSKWLDQHPKLRAINKPNRAAALWCLDPANWPRVEKHLAALDIEERQTITLRTVRRRLDTWAPRAVAPKSESPIPAAPKAAASDLVHEAADRAEVQTLQKEVWRLRDKLDQLSMFLVEKPQPKAEDRPFEKYRYWPLPDKLPERREDRARRERREFVDPPKDDPDFARRREEFEQWLVRRKETLEHQFKAREDELKKTFDARVKERVKKAVDAQMVKERMYFSPLTGAQLKTLLTVLHPDTRDKATMAQKDSAARILVHTRSRLVFKDRDKGSTYIPPDQAPEPPQEERPPAGALS